MKLGVIGAKLGHTASPAIHEALFRILQVEGQHQYGVLEMNRNDIPNELQRLRDEGYTGANVTIPYKLDVMPYLTDISREARTIGAVNTIHFTDEGAFGYNTDYGGFGRSLVHAGIGVKGQDCVVLGTGGGARAIIWRMKGLSLSRSFPEILIPRQNSISLPGESERIRLIIIHLRHPAVAMYWSTVPR